LRGEEARLRVNQEVHNKQWHGSLGQQLRCRFAFLEAIHITKHLPLAHWFTSCVSQWATA
jgi:hypothetical protein